VYKNVLLHCDISLKGCTFVSVNNIVQNLLVHLGQSAFIVLKVKYLKNGRFVLKLNN